MFDLIIKGVAFAAALLVSANQALELATKIGDRLTAASTYILKCRDSLKLGSDPDEQDRK